MRTEYLYYQTNPVLAYEQLRDILKRVSVEDGLEDELLHFDAVMYQNLGDDSRAYERKAVKRTSQIIYEKLKEINPEKHSSLSVD